MVDLNPPSCRDLHEPAVGGQKVDVSLHVLAAHHVEHHVDAAVASQFLYDGDEILSAGS